MKTKKPKTFLVLILTIFLLASIFNRANAANYFTIYTDSLKGNDTVTVCQSADMIKVVPLKGVPNHFWFGNGTPIIDTTYTDTLYIPINYTGLLTCQGNGKGIWIYITPLTITGIDKFITCGENQTMFLYSNYKGRGPLQYNWLPSIGLSDPNIANPIIKVKNSMSYLASITTPNGCHIKDSVKVMMKPMASPNICIVGVNSTNKNIVVWNVPTSASIDSIFLYKETSITDEYKKIAAINIKENNAFVDLDSHPNIQSNKYKISLIDSCGFESEKSITHKTIHLTINQGLTSNTWNLIWEPYEGFTVSTYKIYRGTTSENLELIGTATAGSTQYSDFSAPSGYIYYQIEVVSPNTCYEIKELKAATIITSRSNVATNNPTGINILTSPVTFSLYPNPASDHLFVELNQNSEKGRIDISNIAGQQVLTYTFNSQKSNIDISNLKNGLYLIKMTTEHGVTTQKFLKK